MAVAVNFCASFPIFLQLCNFLSLSNEKVSFFFWPFRANVLLGVAANRVASFASHFLARVI